MKKLIFIIFILMASINVSAQVTRIARVTIDSTKLQPYMALLKEQMETAVRAEPGVISYNVYAEKASPNKLTIVEVYADNNAYLAHRETAHFSSDVPSRPRYMTTATLPSGFCFGGVIMTGPFHTWSCGSVNALASN